jgi:hypothetical protein
MLLRKPSVLRSPLPVRLCNFGSAKQPPHDIIHCLVDGSFGAGDFELRCQPQTAVSDTTAALPLVVLCFHRSLPRHDAAGGKKVCEKQHEHERSTNEQHSISIHRKLSLGSDKQILHKLTERVLCGELCVSDLLRVGAG